jgi:23S rRNA (pseudouridine1915-N3)-methyltransferase
VLIRIITIGKIKNPALAQLERDFLKRLGKYVRMDIKSIKDESISDSQAEASRQKEGQKILEFLKKNPSDVVIALDETGNRFSSHSFAEFLEKRKDLGESITFIIGGPYGLATEVKKEADMLFSLSEMTFTHEIAYTLLLEQLYRACSINSGSKYHKD